MYGVLLKWAYCTFPHSLRLRVVYIMLGDYDLVRLCVAGVLSTALALHGYRKRSLDISGACAAVWLLQGVGATWVGLATTLGKHP